MRLEKLSGVFGLVLTTLLPLPYARAQSADAVRADCASAVSGALTASGGAMTPEVRTAYLNWASRTVLMQLSAAGVSANATATAAIEHDPIAKAALFGAVFPPDPSILQNYLTLSAQLGPDFNKKYSSLLIAVSIARRIKGVETGDQVSAVGRDYQAGFWTDESLRVPSSDGDRKFDQMIADFMQKNGVGASDLYEKEPLRQQLRVYLQASGTPKDQVDSVSKSVDFGEKLKYAMVLLKQRPAARDAKPAPAVWLRHLADVTESTPTSLPTVDGKPLPWPLFPVATAPWPLLMPLEHSVPLAECDYIYESVEGLHGDDRFHTYGPYRGDDDLIANSLNPSRWFWDAWPDRVVHGGECVPISKGTVDLYTALGKPAMWAGQPGHANLISFSCDNGVWTTNIEQPFAGGPDVTTAQWYFDEDPGTEIHYRDLYYWPFSEYHLGLSLAMRVGLTSYMDTRIAANIFNALPADRKTTTGAALLRSALQRNPYNPELWYRLADEVGKPAEEMAIVRAAAARRPGLLSSPPPDDDPRIEGGNADDYWRIVTPEVVRAAILSHPAPHKFEEMRTAYDAVRSLPGVDSRDLAQYVETFAAYTEDPKADNPDYDKMQAGTGDAFAQLRLGLRYRDGKGVPQSDARAQDLMARAAGQGDPSAAVILGTMYPAIPADAIRLTASSTYSGQQAPEHLVNNAGMSGLGHDNETGAASMWHTVGNPAATAPARGVPASPAWVRFDFNGPMRFSAVQIWNLNQKGLTDRGFRSARILGSIDGQQWTPITASSTVELPRAAGQPGQLPVTLSCADAGRELRSVIIEASGASGNWGADCYGLSAVHFVVPRLKNALPALEISVAVSSVYSQLQDPAHLIDGSGMTGSLHDNAGDARTMWHTADRAGSAPPAPGLPASPAWAKFTFVHAQQVNSILIWNHNQELLTDRGFKRVRIYATADGKSWHSITGSSPIELPRASGLPGSEPFAVPIGLNELTFKAVIIAADAENGNYGGSCYGLSAVRFVVGE